MKLRYIVTLTLFSLFIGSQSHAQNSIKIEGSGGVRFTCFSDAGTKFRFKTAKVESLELNRFSFTGEVILENQEASLDNFVADFQMKTSVTRDSRSVTRIDSVIQILNPYLGEYEDLRQEGFISYLEFHILTDDLHPAQSTGFTGNNPAYGFGVQCFFSGL